MNHRESATEAVLRIAKLELLQKAYPYFPDFLDDVMELLGFDTTDIQHDIAEFMQYGPQYLMVQAQRGQAKTTIAAAFAVWYLIHNPHARVLIVSAGGDQASDIAKLIVRIIMNMEELECMRPDRIAGDSVSFENFDIHHSLKGVDKSASVACAGITSNLQGKRADLLIPDDVESKKNSTTQLQRAQLLELTRDFTSINSEGKILYLGTPQSIDSIYNTLPGRGFTVRIWPGRYPTLAQMIHYGTNLAPLIAKRIRDNPALQSGGGLLADQGQPIDPRLGEAVLQHKEQDQGPSYFQLQHMLNTTLNDMQRFPLRIDQLVFTRLPSNGFPLTVHRGWQREHQHPFSIGGTQMMGYIAAAFAAETSNAQGIGMFVDPAGGGANGDETGYAVTAFVNGNIWLLDVGGVPGGFSNTAFEALADIALKWKVNFAQVEKNFGNGAYLNSWLPFLNAKHACAVSEEWASGQKELRIIDTLEPVIARGSLIVNQELIQKDVEQTLRYPIAQRDSYSFFMQLARVTRDPNCLIHDDRLDAVHWAVRYWVQRLGIEQQHAIESQRKAEFEAWLRNPKSKNNVPPAPAPSVLNRFRRR